MPKRGFEYQNFDNRKYVCRRETDEGTSNGRSLLRVPLSICLLSIAVQSYRLVHKTAYKQTVEFSGTGVTVD